MSAPGHMPSHTGFVGDFTRQRHVLNFRRVGASLRSTARVYAENEQIADELVHRIEAYVLAEHLVGDTYTHRARITVKIPASWFQHFKRDYLPTVARRWPVKLHTVAEWRDITVRFDRYATYPGANLSLPSDLGRPVIFESATSS